MPRPGSTAPVPAAPPRGRRWWRWLIGVAIAVAGSVALAAPAAAHLDIASTDPADGGVVKDPSAAVVLKFTRAATPSGGGFTLVDGRGKLVPVTNERADGGATWRVRPVAVLAPGRYGLRWQVTAGDAHPRRGAFTFSVGSAATAARPAARTAAATPAHPPGHAPGSGTHAGAHPGTAGTSTGGDALEAALVAEAGTPSVVWDVAATAARWASLVGILVAVGALVVVVTTLVGSAGDVRLSQGVIRSGAALAAAGAVVEGVCLVATVGAGLPWPPAAALVLRVVAGVALAVTLSLRPRSGGGRRSHDVPALAAASPTGRRAAGAPAGGRTAQLVLTPPVRVGRVRGVPVRPQRAVLLSLALLVSFLLDGHTAIVGPWPLVAAAALTHTAAAAVWVGGVVLLATLLLVRARAGVPTGAGELAVRFSVPATAAVAAAGGAGVALAVLIVDVPGDLVTTPWGRVLLVKLALVVVVALMGYANNRYALPALDAWRPGTARLLRRTVAAEATVMIAVLLVTAVLVASQS